MASRQVRVGGVWLRTMGAFAELNVSHVWPHGSDSVTWRMNPSTYHPFLAKGGALVEVFTGGIRTWRGSLAEPAADGQYAANGIWTEAGGVYALDGSGNATTTIDTALDTAISRGAVSWTRSSSLSGSAWGTAGEPMKLLDLLDQWSLGAGVRWYVDADGAVRSAADPTTPKWVVPQAFAGRGMTLAEDDYYSHLVGKYLAAGPVFATATVGSTGAATEFGYKEALVDLTPMGVISGATATAQLTARLALTGARMGWAENLVLGYGQITTTGGTPTPLTEPVAGDMVRLMGVTDRSRAAAPKPYTDLVIARSEYADGAPTITLTPMGKASRDLVELLKAVA